MIGIYRALIKIGIAGQASIDAVAGPVGEALIMTALGLGVAVPAVLAYNWLQGRNKRIAEQMSAFSNDVLGYMASDGNVKPSTAKAAPGKRPPRNQRHRLRKSNLVGAEQHSVVRSKPFRAGQCDLVMLILALRG